MSINIGPPAVDELRPRITVIGVGGAGGNAIANMIHAGIEGVDFVVSNTDAQALNNSIAEHRIQLGPDITQGLGAGSRPEVGRAAAEETLAEIERALDGVHMCFIAAGMGGGTGTGAAPVIAEIARRKGVLTVGVVTKPFLFEGTRRMRAAEAGIDELQKHVDTLIVIPNQNLFLVAKAETTFKEAFQLADEVLQQGVRSITDLMVMPGLINLDFADVRSVMAEMGKAMMGTGEGEGPHRALEAAERAIANPLLDGVSMKGAKGVIISIIGGDDMRLLEVDEAANHIRDLVDPNANIIWGSAFNPDLDGKIRVSVVATGIEQTAVMAEEASRPFSMGTARGPARPPVGMSPIREVASPAPVAAFSAAPELDRAPASEPHVDQAVASASAKNGSAATGSSLNGAVVTEHEPLELGAEDEADTGFTVVLPVAQPAIATGTRFTAQDEFALDTRSSGEEPAALAGLRHRSLAPGFQPRAATVPAPQRDDGAATPARPVANQEPPARPAAGGGTLFERMASLTGRRKASEEEEDHEDGAINVPRFLGRQNNQ